MLYVAVSQQRLQASGLFPSQQYFDSFPRNPLGHGPATATVTAQVQLIEVGTAKLDPIWEPRVVVVLLHSKPGIDLRLESVYARLRFPD